MTPLDSLYSMIECNSTVIVLKIWEIEAPIEIQYKIDVTKTHMGMQVDRSSSSILSHLVPIVEVVAYNLKESTVETLTSNRVICHQKIQ